jgi:hypothetical protein
VSERGEAAFARALLDPDLPVPAEISPAYSSRYSVYRNNVVAGLAGAMAESFPVVEKLVGPEFFRAMAAEFARAHPPKSPVLMEFGGAFPAFLATFPPVANLPYLPDVARLEQARREAYHAADAVPLPREALAAVPPAALPGLRLKLHPAMRILASPYPVLSIWRWNMLDDRTPLPAHGEQVLVARPDGEVWMRLLTPDQSKFLSALSAGHSLSLALDRIRGADATDMLTFLIGCDLITRLED